MSPGYNCRQARRRLSIRTHADATAGPASAGTSAARSWAVWGLGVVAYTVAVFNRSSLGVAGIEAQHRFGINAAVLSLFAVLQLAVYAGLQIPVGVLVDRLGSRRMILCGAAVMAAGQLLMATAASTPTAVTARVLVGAGDAMTFISVLRLVPAWFPSRRVPLVTQLTGILGQTGQIVAAYPLVAMLGVAGWTATFAGSAAVTVLVALVVLAALRDAPPGTSRPLHTVDTRALRRNLADAWREPGTRLGLWTHFTAQFSGMVFALLWGYPFLVEGEGLSPSTAGLLLSLMVAVTMSVGPPLGYLAGRWPNRRSLMTLGIVGASAASWGLVLVWPGRAPLLLLTWLVLVLGTNGPGSILGFDYARTFNPARRLGSASGIVNVGGFSASLALIFGIGIVLELVSAPGSTAYSLASFRWAFSLQYLLWGIGVLAILRSRRMVGARQGRSSAASAVTPAMTALGAPGLTGERTAGG
ncbi:MAG: MFS transporter [Frankiaceae bacterium]